MTDCAKIQTLLPLSAGGDLYAGSERIVRAHLDECASCRSELVEFNSLINSARTIGSSGDRLPADVKRGIAAEAAAATGNGFWKGIAPGLAWMLAGRTPGLTAATVAAALVALVAIPVAVRNGTDIPAPAATAQTAVAPERIDMQFQEGTVLLAWSDGREGGYVISKSSDPRGLAGVEKHRVAGNAWVDHDPETSRIVYYRIE